MFESLIINLTSSLIYDGAKGLSKKEVIHHALRKIGVHKGLSDFPQRYVETLFALHSERQPREIIAFFKDKDVMQALYEYYYGDAKSNSRNNPTVFLDKLKHHLVAAKTGDDLKTLNLDFEMLAKDFVRLFEQKIHESKSLSQIQVEETTKQILEKGVTQEKISKEILEEIKNRDSQNSVNHNIEETKTKITTPKHLTDEIPTLSQTKTIGREADLEDIHTRLFDNKQVVLMNGLGGIGKTTLAQVYVDEFWEDYNHVVWISQLSENIINDFANKKGLISNLKVSETLTKSEDIFNEIIRELSKIENSPSLLVLDNADISVEKIRDRLPKQPNWHTLITSRQKLKGFDLKKLDFLKPEDALILFKFHYTLDKLSDEQIKTLVQKLGFHTLAIEILAKTAQLIEYSYEELFNALNLNLETELEDVNHAETTIEKITGYLISIFEISQNQFSAEELFVLKQFICLPSEFISKDLLKELSYQDKSYKKLGLILNKLTKKGWLLKQKDANSYKMHRIIIEILKKQIPITINNDVVFLISSISDTLDIDQSKDNPINKFEYIPFGNSILDIVENQKIITPEERNRIANLQNNLSSVLKALGSYQEAKKLSQKAKRLAESFFGKEHYKTSPYYTNLGLLHQLLGDYTDAKKLLEKAKVLTENEFGKKHVKTISTYSNLASVMKDLGKYNEAKNLLEECVSFAESFFKKNDSKTATYQSNLSIVLSTLGYYNKAKELLEKAIVSDKINFGVNHPTTQLRFSNLGALLYKTDSFKNAKVVLESVKKFDEKYFKEDSIHRTRTYSSLGLVLSHLGYYNKAKVLLEKDILQHENVFGNKHPNTGIRYLNLGGIYYSEEKYQLAFELINKAYIIHVNEFGENHPHTIQIKGDLDTCKSKL